MLLVYILHIQLLIFIWLQFLKHFHTILIINTENHSHIKDELNQYGIGSFDALAQKLGTNSF